MFWTKKVQFDLYAGSEYIRYSFSNFAGAFFYKQKISFGKS